VVTADLTFVGTATTVLRLGAFTLLTDPNLIRRGQRVHLGSRGDERLRITAVPGQHGPAGVHRLLPPVIGTVLDLETMRRRGHAARLLTVGRGETLDLFPAPAPG
jgi:hypothetical protein